MSLLGILYDIMERVSRMIMLLSVLTCISVTIVLYTTLYHTVQTLIIGLVLAGVYMVIHIVLTSKMKQLILRQVLVRYMAGRDKRIKTMLEHAEKLYREIKHLEDSLRRKDVDKNYVRRELERKRSTYVKLKWKLEQAVVKFLVEDTDEIMRDLGNDIGRILLSDKG